MDPVYKARRENALIIAVNCGLALTRAYMDFDAAQWFPVETVPARHSSDCISGDILLGLQKPDQCSSFGTACTPDQPLGAPMVSSEGACEILVLDPLYVANEGRFVAILPEKDSDKAQAIIQKHFSESPPRMIRYVKEGTQPVVTLENFLSSHRVLDLPSGEQLPRIC